MFQLARRSLISTLCVVMMSAALPSMGGCGIDFDDQDCLEDLEDDLDDADDFDDVEDAFEDFWDDLFDNC